MGDFFSKRMRALRRCLDEAGVEALVVTHRPNWFYLTGFTGEAGALIVSRHRAALITDGRFTVQARAEVRGARVTTYRDTLLASAGKWLKANGIRRAGFDPARLTVSQLREARRGAGVRTQWKAVPGAVEALRAIKDASELAAMRAAARLGSEVMESAIQSLRPGLRELEVAAEIEYQMRKCGATGPAFETIVASGKRSALPHARPTLKRLRKNELVVLDLGAILRGYCCDLTRTVFLGRAPGRLKRWYKAVREAQAAGIEGARAGVSCGDVDAAARGVLAGYGLESHFVHSTGHGLGLEVHEEPRLAKGQKGTLQAGQVVTIEPGVYVEGVGGIRIEDEVAVLGDRNEVLTRVPRDLIEL
jgi:Xaa-Pro aminopeptidase